MKIITHDGAWHADEVLAIGLISIVTKTPFMNIYIERTRNQEVLDKALKSEKIYVLDVGAQYNPDMLNFDHHQRGFDLTNEYGNKYSTFGLVVNHFKDKFSEDVYKRLSEFANMVDCQDNGITSAPELFWIRDMNNLGDFKMALHMATNWLKAKLDAFNKDAKMDNIIHTALEKSSNGIVSSTERLVIDERLNKHTNLQLAVFPSTSGGFTVQSLNVGLEPDFSVRCPMPEQWRGLRDAKLEEVSGMKGMIFCHANGFMCVVDKYNNAMEVAKHIIELNSRS